jgi:hypothetical protein
MKTILIFDFGTDEEAAQQARHRAETWKQSFRLGEKLMVRFERGEAADGNKQEPAGGHAEAGKGKVEQKTKAGDAHRAGADSAPGIRLAVLLHFSPHEKLSYQRWLERMRMEKPFAGVPNESISDSGENFEATAEWFDSLESAPPVSRSRR